MVKRIDKIPLLLFLILPGILIFCWFRFGHMYGGGDTGLPIYNSLAMANIASNIWFDSLAPGIPVANTLTVAPILYMLSIPQILGASPVFIQALMFFILLFLMGYGMYLLALSIFGKSNYLLAITAGVFYLFNPYMMIQIWHRFIFNAMFFVAFLPFLIMTWRAWIQKRNPKYLLLFLLTNFLAVYMFGTIAFIVAIWALLFFLTLLEGVVPWKGRKVALSLFFAFLIGFVFWLLTNSWWLITTFNVSPALFASVHTTDGSLGTLMALSASTILPYTLRLINPFYLYWLADWGSIYQNPIFLLISWLFVLVVVIGFIRGLKQKQYIIWSLLFLIMIFLSKGAAPPFNFPYIWGFSHFFPLGVIRNPFEKLGIILPLIYAILFSYGLQFLLITSIKFIGKFKTIFILTIFILLHMAFFWPMFAGKLFGTLDKQNFIEVPASYTEANNWIKQDLSGTNEGRILHLPLPTSEAVAYNWQYGYHGIEPSAGIFTSLPSIARGLDIPGVNDALSGLSLIFHKPYADNNQAVILKMLQDFSVKYILLHKDIEWLGGELYDPLETETVLDNLDFLDRETTFGDLTIYKLKDIYFQPKIIISDNINFLYPSKKNLFWPWMVSTPSAQMIGTIQQKKDSSVLDRVNKIIVFSERATVVKNLEVPEFKGNLDNFNSIRLPPNSPYYFLIEIKEKISLIGRSQADQQQMKIIFADKRLVELYKIKRMRESGIIGQEEGNWLIISSINKYKSILNDIFKGELPNDVIISNQQFSIMNVFLKHISILEEFDRNSYDNDGEKEDVRGTILLIKKLLVGKGLLPEYPLGDENGLTTDYRQEYVFDILEKSTYELLMSGSDTKGIYPNFLSEMNFQINNSYKKFKEEDKGNLMSFGESELGPGKYQISTERLRSINLLPQYSGWSKSGNVNISESTGIIDMSSGKQSVSYIEGDIKPALGGDIYLFNFDLKILSGRGIRVQIIQDTDIVDKKTSEAVLRYDNYYVPSNFDSNNWNHFEAIIDLFPTTQEAKLKIQVEPWDDCLTLLNDKKRCSDEKVRKQYNQPSKFFIKNINVYRLLDNDIFLRANLSVSQSSTPSGMVLEVNRQSSSFYSGRIRILKPTLIFFKESFDPGWELSLVRNKEIYKPSQHLVANLFANAWLIEQPGDYDFVLNYSPQKFIKAGMVLAGLGLVIVLIFVVGYNFRRLTFKNEK